jgi:hypothetical protein
MIDPQDHHPQRASQRPSATTAQSAGLKSATPAVVRPSPLVRVAAFRMLGTRQVMVLRLASKPVS